MHRLLSILERIGDLFREIGAILAIVCRPVFGLIALSFRWAFPAPSRAYAEHRALALVRYASDVRSRTAAFVADLLDRSLSRHRAPLGVDAGRIAAFA